MFENSLEYLIVAMKSPEIQAKRIKGAGKLPFEEGDFYAEIVDESWYTDVYDGTLFFQRYSTTEDKVTEIAKDGESIRKDLYIVFLPTVGQILEFVEQESHISFRKVISLFNAFLYCTQQEYLDKFTSKEEVALAFYYRQVHGKTWDSINSVWIHPEVKVEDRTDQF